MAFIRLRTDEDRLPGPPIRYLDEQGREQVVPILRLYASIRIGKDSRSSSVETRNPYNAILDTAAPLTVIPKLYWQEFASQIVRLPIVGDRPAVGRVGGRHFTYFLGRVWITVFDMFGRHLPAVPVVAQFREDEISPGERVPLLLGLWGGILEGRHLTRWPTTERYDPDIPTLESHGQWWNLSEP